MLEHQLHGMQQEESSWHVCCSASLAGRWTLCWLSTPKPSATAASSNIFNSPVGCLELVGCLHTAATVLLLV
jgi:hypothetical protein